MNIILASKSPRRIEILHRHGIDAVVIPTETDESIPAGTGMTEAVELLARRKAKACYDAVHSDYQGHVIIGADTIVWKDEIMGKPEDSSDVSEKKLAVVSDESGSDDVSNSPYALLFVGVLLIICGVSFVVRKTNILLGDKSDDGFFS